MISYSPRNFKKYIRSGKLCPKNVEIIKEGQSETVFPLFQYLCYSTLS